MLISLFKRSALTVDLSEVYTSETVATYFAVVTNRYDEWAACRVGASGNVTTTRSPRGVMLVSSIMPS